MAVTMYPDEYINYTVSHLPGVGAAVAAAASIIASKATARLALHRDEGHARITVSHGDVDSFVNLDDPDAAWAIEKGHRHNFTGGHVQGIGVLAGAAGLT